jgi:CRP-like cAMP-binding protein
VLSPTSLVSEVVIERSFLISKISHLNSPIYHLPMNDQLSQLPFSPADMALLAERWQEVNHHKGDNLVLPGQVQQHLYLVLEGVQMSFFETERKLHVQAFTYAPGFCAVPESFLAQKPSSYTLTCLLDSRFLSLHFSQLQEAFALSHSLERKFRQMTEQVLVGVLQRHLELHTLTMEQRFREFCARSPHLLQRVPHKYLASYLGIDPTNFSKLYNSVRI